jgi:alkylhydroperoxidase family enzyme
MNTTEDLAAREELILGHPQRMQPVERNAESESIAMGIWRRIRCAITGKDADPGPVEAIPEIHFTMLRHPDLWEKISNLSIQLSAHGKIAPRERELLILRTGWLCRAPFEWGEHVKFGLQLGLTAEEIERVKLGSAAADWNAHDRALMQAVEELHGDAMISDATWDALRETYSEEECFELTVLVGQFVTTAFWLNSLRIPLNPGIRKLTDTV